MIVLQNGTPLFTSIFTQGVLMETTFLPHLAHAELDIDTVYVHFLNVDYAIRYNINVSQMVL